MIHVTSMSTIARIGMIEGQRPPVPHRKYHHYTCTACKKTAERNFLVDENQPHLTCPQGGVWKFDLEASEMARFYVEG